MKNNVMTKKSESTNVIVCIMTINSIMWWVNNKNIFPLAKGFIKKSTDSIFNLRHAFSILNSHIYPTFNKTNGKASTPTLLKLFCHCIQDICDSFMTEKQNNIPHSSGWFKVSCMYLHLVMFKTYGCAFRLTVVIFIFAIFKATNPKSQF